MAGEQVVVGVDGSGPSVEALEWAVQEAVVRDVPLNVVYVLEPTFLPSPTMARSVVGELSEMKGAAHRLVDDMVRRARELAPSVEVTGSVHRGHPVVSCCGRLLRLKFSSWAPPGMVPCPVYCLAQ